MLRELDVDNLDKQKREILERIVKLNEDVRVKEKE